MGRWRRVVVRPAIITCVIILRWRACCCCCNWLKIDVLFGGSVFSRQRKPSGLLWMTDGSGVHFTPVHQSPLTSDAAQAWNRRVVGSGVERSWGHSKKFTTSWCNPIQRLAYIPRSSRLITPDVEWTTDVKARRTPLDRPLEGRNRTKTPNLQGKNKS